MKFIFDKRSISVFDNISNRGWMVQVLHSHLLSSQLGNISFREFHFIWNSEPLSKWAREKKQREEKKPNCVKILAHEWYQLRRAFSRCVASLLWCFWSWTVRCACIPEWVSTFVCDLKLNDNHIEIGMVKWNYNRHRQPVKQN